MTTIRPSDSHHDWTGVSVPEFYESPLVLQAQGDWACFTRPEMNSERVSYPLITPSAAQGLLASVFWKPQFRWAIQTIEVLAPIRWTTIRRNEVDSGITRDMVSQGYMDANKRIQQRMTLMLRDVKYRIFAQMWVHPEADEQNPAKWRDQFRRRVNRGQTFRTPFFGMREFHADICPPDGTSAIPWTEELGVMLHSIWVDNNGREYYEFFDAHVEQGRMDIPARGDRMEIES